MPYSRSAIYLWMETEVKHAVRLNMCKVFNLFNIYCMHCHVKHQWRQNTSYSNVLYHLHLYLILKLQITPVLDNGVKLTLKCCSFILLIFIIKSLQEGGEQGVNLPSPYFLSQFLPPPYFFEPISLSSLNGYISFSPSSQLCLGHFSLLPILFLPPH